MSRRMTAIFSGLSQGLERATNTLQEIALAKYKIEREKESDKLERRVKESLLKKSEFELQNAELEATQNKQIHEDAMKRMQTAAATIHAISSANMDGKFGTGVNPNTVNMGASTTGNEMTPGRASGIAEISQGAPGLSYMEAVQEGLPAGTSAKVGSYTVKSKKQENTDEEIKRIVAEKGIEGLTATQKAYYQRNVEKGISYTDIRRDDLMSAADRIKSGQSDSQTEKKNLLSKYPDMSYETLENLKDIEKIYKPENIKRNKDLKSTAIQELRKAGYPITENNIKSAIDQLRGR